MLFISKEDYKMTLKKKIYKYTLYTLLYVGLIFSCIYVSCVKSEIQKDCRKINIYKRQIENYPTLKNIEIQCDSIRRIINKYRYEDDTLQWEHDWRKTTNQI